MTDGKVIDLDSQRPHTAGTARCLNCGNVWHAVIPTGTAIVECPECGDMRGRRTGIVFPPDDEATFRCMVCIDEEGVTNDLMVLTRTGAFCAGCGARHTWETVAKGTR